MKGTDMNKDNNTSDIAVPAAIKQWNWGAFLMSWIWGLGNGTYIALLCLVPVVNLVMIFVLGAKGSAWAWKNREWESEAQFTRVQGLWTAFGLGLLAGYAISLVLLIIALVVTFNNVFM
jgi:ABC-type Fe3+ transport system permease subunit